MLAFTWTEFFQQVVSGLASGGIYASLALAIVLIYRSTRVINFAQGEMATFTTFVAWSLTQHGLSKWLAFPLTLAIAFAGGVLLQRVVIRPVENAPPLTVVILTVGLLIGLNGLSAWIWGGDAKSFPSLFSTRPIRIAGVAFSIQDFGVIGVSIGAVVAITLFFRFTRVGLAMRAAAVNPESSALVGIRVGWMLALGWGLAAALGALSGILVAPSVFLDPNMMLGVLLYAFAAAVLGGLDSPVGAVVGGLSLGVLLNLVGTYGKEVSTRLDVSDVRLAVALAIILLVLLVRPGGLFGRPVARKV
jgi:branched-chain amino acid transport system permease protein